MRSMIVAACAILATFAPALAQNSFPTAGGAVVKGRVMLQVNAGSGQAESCPGPTAGRSNYPTAGGSVANARVKLCLDGSNKAVACPTKC